MQHLYTGATLQGGKYRIESKLGQGGFGITYVAIQSGLERRVAIKEFFIKEFCERDEKTTRVTLCSKGSYEIVNRYREKFLKEARNIASLNHPHIVRVIDVFEENGTAYYVMEYAERGSLADMVKHDGYLPEPVATRYILQVAEALDYIHQHKMNHLDVKPANILLNDMDQTLLIDFGLAKHYDSTTDNQTSKTPVGISEGYAPTEQYMVGGVARFSPETDVYALGATFYKLLTGMTPPNASYVGNEGLPQNELVEKGVSQRTVSLIVHAMQGRRKDRIQSMRYFIDELNGVASAIDNEETKFAEDTDEEMKPARDYNGGVVIVGGEQFSEDTDGHVQSNENRDDSSILYIETERRERLKRMEEEARVKANKEKAAAAAAAKAEKERAAAEARAKSEKEKAVARARAKAEKERAAAEAKARREKAESESKPLSREEKIRKQKQAFVMSKMMGESVQTEDVNDERYERLIEESMRSREKKPAGSLSERIKARIVGMDRSTRFLLPCVIGGGFNFVAFNTWAHVGAPDADGRLLWNLFLLLTVILFLVIVFCIKDKRKLLHGGLICLGLSLLNSCLLEIWNYSLSDPYMLLSYCLSFLSATMLAKKL